MTGSVPGARGLAEVLRSPRVRESDGLDPAAIELTFRDAGKRRSC